MASIKSHMSHKITKNNFCRTYFSSLTSNCCSNWKWEHLNHFILRDLQDTSKLFQETVAERSNQSFLETVGKPMGYFETIVESVPFKRWSDWIFLTLDFNYFLFLPIHRPLCYFFEFLIHHNSEFFKYKQLRRFRNIILFRLLCKLFLEMWW